VPSYPVERSEKMLDTFVPSVMIHKNIETSEDNFTDHASLNPAEGSERSGVWAEGNVHTQPYPL